MSDVEFLTARPNLLVSDVLASVAFYRDKLGFAVEGELADRPSFALVRRQGVEIGLLQEYGATPLGCTVYVRGVRALHDQWKADGLKIVDPLIELPWGILRFLIEDPDGNSIAICERLRDHA